jgi:6,7-dimethyl-8-ribityllumazine synthase
MKIIEGVFAGKGHRVALVAARFNELIVSKLIEGARDCLVRHGVEDDALELAWVPGAYEVPLVAGKLAATKKYDAVITLGAVIRGSTPHFDYVAAEVSKGVAAESLRTGVPIIFGVLTCDTLEQALERAGVKAGNKGWDAGLAALEMMNLFTQLPSSRT